MKFNYTPQPQEQVLLISNSFSTMESPMNQSHVTTRSPSVSPTKQSNNNDGSKKRRRPSPYETKIDFTPEEKQVVEIKRTMRTQKLMWTPQLHIIFLTALQELGLNAVPKQLHTRMNVAGLTRENVASHLQKFRQRMKKKKYLAHQVQQLIIQEQLKAAAAIRNSKAQSYEETFEDYSPELSPVSFSSSSSPSPSSMPEQSLSFPTPVEVDDSLFASSSANEVYGERRYVYRQSVDDLSNHASLQEATMKYYNNNNAYSGNSESALPSNYIRDLEYEHLFPEMCSSSSSSVEQLASTQHPLVDQAMNAYNPLLSFYPRQPMPASTTAALLNYCAPPTPVNSARSSTTAYVATSSDLVWANNELFTF